VMVAEGVRTTRAAIDLGRKFNVELPIITGVGAVLFRGASARDAINQLMNRPPQEEMSWMQSGE
jgi:glycerol-3-phosphate dehydrogenase (NAD(P)+)